MHNYVSTSSMDVYLHEFVVMQMAVFDITLIISQVVRFHI